MRAGEEKTTDLYCFAGAKVTISVSLFLMWNRVPPGNVFGFMMKYLTITVYWVEKSLGPSAMLELPAPMRNPPVMLKAMRSNAASMSEDGPLTIRVPFVIRISPLTSTPSPFKESTYM